MSNELTHYGVKGMKWGIRRQRKSTNDKNPNYTEKQRKNDRAFYGSKGERRINRNLNKGYGLKGARHIEVEKRDKKVARKKAKQKAVKAASKAIATIGSLYLTDQFFYGGAGTKLVKKTAKTAGRIAVTAALTAMGHENIRWRD